MAAFDQFYTLILPFAKGAAEPAMDSAIRQAAIEFCEKTKVWNEVADRVNIAAGVNTYDIDPINGGIVVEILEMSFDGRPVEAKSPADLDMKYSQWTDQTAERPAFFTQLNPDQFVLVPKPSTAKRTGLSYRAAYRPSETAQAVPDLLHRHYARPIADGALAILLEEPGTPYHNPDRAMYRMALFENRILEVRTDVQLAFSKAPIRTRGSYF